MLNGWLPASGPALEMAAMKQFATRTLLLVIAPWGLLVLLALTIAGLASAAEPAAANLPRRAPVQIGTTNFRKRNFLTHLAFSPDSKQIAAVSANEPYPTVTVFEVATGIPVRELNVADATHSRTSCVAFSLDGKRLLWGETDGHIAVWDLAGSQLVFRGKLHAAEVCAAIYSPLGDIVASCSTSGEIHLRDANNPGEALHVVRIAKPDDRRKGRGFGGGGAGYVLTFTPDGKQLVAGSKEEAKICVCNVADGSVGQRVELAHGTGRAVNPSLNSLAVTPDGRQIMSGGQRTVLSEQTKLKYVPKNVTLSQVHFWDLETGQRAAVLNGEEDYGFGYAALSPDGKTVAVGDFSRLKFYDVVRRKLLRTIELPGWWGKQPVFSPDGLLVAVPDDNAVGLFEVATGKRLHHDDRTPVRSVQSAAWSRSGDRIVTGHHDGNVRVWDSHSGTLIWCRELAPVISFSGWHAGPALVDFSPDGHSVVVAGRRDDPVEFQNGIIVIYDAATGDRRREMTLTQTRNGALSPDGKTVVAATNYGGIGQTHLHGFDTTSGRLLFEMPPKDQKIGLWDAKVMQFRPDSKTLLVATGGGDLYHFNARTGEQLKKLLADYRTPEQIQAGRPREPQLWTGTFSANGKALVSSSAEWIYVWDADTAALQLQIRHPHDHGCNLCLAPDGRTLAASDLLYAGDYGVDAIRLYDIETGNEVLTLESAGDRAVVLSFSPDGKRLFTGLANGSALIWDVGREGK